MPGLRKYIVLLHVMIIPALFAFGQYNPLLPIQMEPEPGPADQPYIAPEINKASAIVNVRSIQVIGNKRTREQLILREIPFKENEQYSLEVLVKKFEDARRQLMNTLLFHEVIVALAKTEGSEVDVRIEVSERWYIFPLPYFRHVDRNINQWLVENNGDMNRVNYGVKLLHNNATGMNDKFNLWIINGYTKQLSLSYDRMYIDKKMNWGLNVGMAMGKNREINYNTVNNKQLFYKNPDEFVRSFFKANAEVSYRRAIKTRHKFGIGYSSETVSDSVVKLNPGYFRDGRRQLQYPEVYYSMSYWDVDYIPYPLTGYLGELHFVKKGLNREINLWQVMARIGGGWKVGKDLYFNSRLSGTVKFPFKQPFINQRLLGYNDMFLQGYEYYVMDGVAGAVAKATLTRQLFNFNIHYRKNKAGRLDYIPIRIFAKAYANSGYVHQPGESFNQLNNRLLYSGGFGLDIITLYDFSIKLEWSMNHLMQNGIYLHRKTNF